MSGLNFLKLYFTFLPIAVVADALFLTGGVALLRRWRRVQAQTKDQEITLDH